MKLIQFNLWQGRILREALRFLEEEQPDFVNFQEIYSGPERTRAFNFLDGFEQAKDLFPSYYGYFSPCMTFRILDKRFGYGNAMLSRYPLKNTETFFIHKELKDFDRFEDFQPFEGYSEPRNMQRTTVDLPDGKTFCLVNHHGYWEPNDVGSEVTVEKIARVAEIVQDSPRPLIFAGDLQIIAKSPAMKPLHAQLNDLTDRYGLKTTLNVFGKVKNVACDHILVSEGVKVKSFKTGDTLSSDHIPLILEFDL